MVAHAAGKADTPSPTDPLTSAAADSVTILRYRRLLLRRLRREPIAEELAQATGLSAARIMAVRAGETGQDGSAEYPKRMQELLASGLVPDTLC